MSSIINKSIQARMPDTVPLDHAMISSISAAILIGAILIELMYFQFILFLLGYTETKYKRLQIYSFSL